MHVPSIVLPSKALIREVTGWLHQASHDVGCVRAVDMWRPLGCADSERFALVWESEELKALNNTLFSFVKNKVHSCPHAVPHYTGHYSIAT